MKMEMGLAQRQTLQITMTQELQQAITILQYSAQELTSFLEMKAMENPLIQLESPIVKLIDMRNERVRSRNSNHTESDRDKWLEQIADTSDNLSDYLLSQLGMEALSVGERNFAEQLIYHLDKNGYLTISLEEAARINNIDQGTAEKCLTFIQSLDPPGVAARSLQECLLLQVRRIEGMPKLVTALLESDFADFAERKWKAIADRRSVSLADIQAAADLIKKLNPRPGAQFNTERSHYVIPDLILQMNGGKLELQLCEKHMPTITYQSDYYKQMASRGDQQVNQFLGEKRQDFHWLMNSLEQRRMTLIKVGTAILDIQKDFFLKRPGLFAATYNERIGAKDWRA